MSPLDKVLLRDLWRQKTQVMAIMVVMALGVLILVMMEGLVSTLLETKAAYYERQRFADAYAPVVRAPASVVAQVEALEGVKAAEGRLASSAQIHALRRGSERLFDDQVAASVLSLPDFGEPRLNNILIMEGRVPSAASAKEVVVLHAFYQALGLALGDEIDLKIQGELHAFTIVGAAMAPEFLYVTAPGEIAPDPKRFAVLWMAENTLAPLLSMDGAINEILLDLDRGADLESVLGMVEDTLERYGSLGAYGRADQPSNRYLSEELIGLQVSSTVVPPIFLAISAFLLNMVVAR
ncbi:MAG: ABC transporter permease, partial [Alphaproteobacteria bacterium]